MESMVLPGRYFKLVLGNDSFKITDMTSPLQGIKTALFFLFKKTLTLLPAKHIGRFDGARKAYNLVMDRLKPSTAMIQGHLIHLDPHDSLALSVTETYEPFETEVFQRLLRPGDTVIDLGANIGIYTLLAAKIIGPSGSVWAFEPDPRNFALLTKNIQENGYTQITAVQKAVSHQSGFVSLFRSPINWGDHRLLPSPDHQEMVHVESVTLDDYPPLKTTRVHAIKMDIQGAEGLALQGMVRLLARQPTLAILMEFWPEGLDQNQTPPIILLDLLMKNHFELFAIFEDQCQLTPLTGTTEQIIGNIRSRVGKHFTTLLCLKGLPIPKR